MWRECERLALWIDNMVNIFSMTQFNEIRRNFLFLAKHVKSSFFDRSMKNIVNTNVSKIKNASSPVRHEHNVSIVVMQNASKWE